MSKGELILDKMNLIIEAINEHMGNCPNCHLKTILRKIIGDSIN
jgi:hypothetical protein